MEKYSSTYLGMLDDELLRLLDEFDELERDAASALVSEVRARGLTADEISHHIETGRKRRISVAAIEGADLELTSQIGSVRAINGSGLMFLGKSNYFRDEEYAYEEYDTTLCLTLLWFPLIPMGAFRVRQKLHHGRPDVFPPTEYPYIAIRRLPVKWLYYLPIVFLVIALIAVYSESLLR